jgi:hypothetical protein
MSLSPVLALPVSRGPAPPYDTELGLLNVDDILQSPSLSSLSSVPQSSSSGESSSPTDVATDRRLAGISTTICVRGVILVGSDLHCVGRDGRDLRYPAGTIGTGEEVLDERAGRVCAVRGVGDPWRWEFVLCFFVGEGPVPFQLRGSGDSPGVRAMREILLEMVGVALDVATDDTDPERTSRDTGLMSPGAGVGTMCGVETGCPRESALVTNCSK